jgi:ABC-2 type transport system permease protein
MSDIAVSRRVVVPAAAVSLPSVFVATMRSEWTKLRTVRSTMWALLFTIVSTIGLGTLLTWLEVSRWDHRSLVQIADFDPLLYSLAGINLAQLSIGVLGVLVMTSEYATGAIALTFGATPQRRLVLAAKVATFSIVVAIVSLISCLTAFFIGQAILAPKNAGVSFRDPGVARAVLGGVMHLVLIGAIAIAVGAIVRRTAGAVALLFTVLLVVPGLVTLLPSPWNDTVTKYLPNAAGAAMSAVVRFPNLLSPLGGVLVLVAYTTGTLLVAAFCLTRRDA